MWFLIQVSLLERSGQTAELVDHMVAVLYLLFFLNRFWILFRYMVPVFLKQDWLVSSCLWVTFHWSAIIFPLLSFSEFFRNGCMNHFWPVTCGGKSFLLPLSLFQNGNIFFHSSLLLHEDALHRFDIHFFGDNKSVNKQTQGHHYWQGLGPPWVYGVTKLTDSGTLSPLDLLRYVIIILLIV